MPTAVDHPLARHVPPTLGATFSLQWLDSSGDGYQWCNAVDELPATGPERWAVVAQWGRDGFDLGIWPYITYARGVVERPGGIAPYRIVERVEGDCTLWAYPTQAAMFAALDSLARRSWSEHPERHGPGMVEVLEATGEGEALPVRFRGPFSWDRLGVFAATGIDPLEVTP